MSAIANTIAPYITRVLRGEKIPELSFVDHPPFEWSWNIAMALTIAILEPQTKKHWSTNPEMGLQEMAAHLGETWVNRSTVNFKKHPEIFAHATALMETLLMRSKGALERLYGPDGVKVAHFTAQGMHRQGMHLSNKWMTHYYDMRQSIETDDALQSHINEHVQTYPSSWSNDKERHYRMNDYSGHWPILPHHQPCDTSVDWFNPQTYSVETMGLSIHTDRVDAEPVTEINGRPAEGLSLDMDGHVVLENLIGQHYNVAYELAMAFSIQPIAGVRPLHLSLQVNASHAIPDDTSLQQTHAWAVVRHLKESLGFWLNTPLVRNKIREAPFQPSLSLRCNLRDPSANTIWFDTLNEQLQEFLAEKMGGQ